MPIISGTAGPDMLTGTPGDDLLFGYGGDDTLIGNGGNDRFFGGLGADRMIGGDGNDAFILVGAEIAAGEMIDGGGGFNRIFTWGGDLSAATISNVQSLGVHGGALTLSAAQFAAFSCITAHDGVTTLTASEPGVYRLLGKDVTGAVNLTGSAGDDVLVGNQAGQTLTGGKGNDVLQGMGGADIMLGGEGDDEFMVGGDEVVAGEVIDGGSGVNMLSTWGGDLSVAAISNIQILNIHLNTLTVGAAQFAQFAQVLTCDGPVVLSAADAGTYDLSNKSVAGVVSLVGSGGDDVLVGDYADQVLMGGDGDDVLQGLGGADHMFGGDGNDEFLIGGDEIVSGEYIDGGTGWNKVSVWGGDLSKASIHNVQELGIHASTLTLDAAQLSAFDKITAYDGPVTLQAAGPGQFGFYDQELNGVFNLVGTDLDDSLFGSRYAFSETGVGRMGFIDAGKGDDWIAAFEGTVVYGGDGNDTIRLYYGNNTAYGGDGDDIFENTHGSNALHGGNGNDTYIVPAAIDVDSHALITATIYENDATPGNDDRLVLSTNWYDQLWFSRAGDDLDIQVIGVKSIAVIKDWFLGDAHHVENIVDIGGNVLAHTDVQALVDAMAALPVPATEFMPVDYVVQLSDVLTSSWATA